MKICILIKLKNGFYPLMKISTNLLFLFLLCCRNQENASTLPSEKDLEDKSNLLSDICNFLPIIYEYMSKAEDILGKLRTTKKDINLYFDKISEEGTSSYPNVFRNVVLNLYDVIYSPKKIIEDKSQDDKRLSKDLPPDIISFNTWGSMCQEVMKGNFLSVPDNIALEHEFIRYLTENCNDITAEEYNNISKFLHIVKDRKEYNYNSRLESKIPKHTLLFGTKIGLVDILTDLFVVGVNNQEQILKTVKECCREIENYYEKEENTSKV